MAGAAAIAADAAKAGSRVATTWLDPSALPIQRAAGRLAAALHHAHIPAQPRAGALDERGSSGNGRSARPGPRRPGGTPGYHHGERPLRGAAALGRIDPRRPTAHPHGYSGPRSAG